MAEHLRTGEANAVLLGAATQAIIVFTDYPNRSRDKSPREMFPEVDAEDIERLRAGQAVLIVDHSREGPRHDVPFSGLLHEWADLHRIDRRSVVHSTTNHAFPASFAAWRAEDGIESSHQWLYFNTFVTDVAKFGRMALSADETMDKLRSDRHEKRFLCLNNVARPHRLLIAAHLLDKRHSDALVSMGSTKGDLQSITKFENQVVGLYGSDEFQRDYGEVFLQATHANVLDNCTITPSSDAVNQDRGRPIWAQLDLPLYYRTAVSVVTETEMTQGHIDRLTEKSLKPFMLGHVALVAGNPGVLKRVREMGFETFDPVIDESYDEIVDPAHRLHALLGEIDRLRNMERQDFSRMLEVTCEIRRENLRFGHESFEPATNSNLAKQMTKILSNAQAR